MFKFVEPSATMITEADPFKHIERVGRTCYKSEDRITDDSAYKFVRGLMKSQHTAMVEHAVFVFQLKRATLLNLTALHNCPYLNVTMNGHNGRILASANVRALNEQAATNTGAALLLAKLYEQCPGMVYADKSLYEGKDAAYIDIVNIDTLDDLATYEVEAHKYLSFRFITDRGVTHEMVRHRPPSYGQESTRYVNYLEGISICLPTGFYERAPEVQEEYQKAFAHADEHYRNLINMGEKPQQARAVLPNALKTEIVMTTNIAEWNHVWNLRVFGTTGAPHPDIKTIMQMAYDQAGTDPTVAKYYLMREAA